MEHFYLQGELQAYLANLHTLLSTLRNNGDDVTKWGTTLVSENADLRSLAARRLAEIGTPEAAQVLTATFRRIDAISGRTILRALGGIDQPAL